MSKDPHATDLHDHLQMMKMDSLTYLARHILPPGYWGAPKDVAQSEKHLYLTFDDGPHPDTTLRLLELFDQEQVKVTFFVLGTRAQRHPELITEIAKHGHAIGNHSFSHQMLPLMTTKMIEREISDTNTAIKEASGKETVLFRPPFGLLDQRGAQLVKERSMKTVYWGSVSEDWMGIGEKRVIGRTMRRLAHGTLIVLHEGRRIANQTLTATSEIIKLSKERGYSFETVPH